MTTTSFNFVRNANPRKDGRKGVVYHYTSGNDQKEQIFDNNHQADKWYAAEQNRIRTQAQ